MVFIVVVVVLIVSVVVVLIVSVVVVVEGDGFFSRYFARSERATVSGLW